jgi:hypothetical protein
VINEWPPLYKVKRHRRARHVRLRASEPHGLEITVPYRFNLRELPSILEENKGWIEKQLAKLTLRQPDILPQKIELHACSESWTISYLNLDKKIDMMPRHHLKEIIIIGNIDDKAGCKAKLIEWLRNQAKLYLPDLLNSVSDSMQLQYEKVTIRDQKTLWGSCTIEKVINLNYKLLFLPLHLVRHIMIHELSHTVHLNHSTNFWNLVAKYDAAWKDHRRELRKADDFIPQWVK